MTAPAAPPEREIVLQSTVAETRRLHEWLDGALAAGALPARLENAVRLCLEEAVMNVVMHGHGEGEPGEIVVSLGRGPGAALWARVADRAPPFNPVAAPLPPAHRPSLQEGPLGGRGLRLMRRFAADLHYERRDGQNLLTLRFAD